MPGRSTPSRRQAIALALAGTVSALAAPVAAQDADWPTDPITIVVPFDAGGSADRMARTLAGPLGDELGVLARSRTARAGSAASARHT